MPVRSVSVFIDRQERSITPGAVLGRDLLALAAIAPPEQLLLEKEGDIDVPIAPTDVLFIQGGERFSIGDGTPPIDDNPCVREPVHFRFNKEPVPAERLFPKAKVTGAELKRLDPNAKDSDGLYADLPGLADEPIRDDQRVILQRRDQFIVVPCGNVGFDAVLEKHLEEVRRQYPDARIEETGSTRYLVVPNFPAPAHFVPRDVTLLALVPNGYPMAAPDMFWVSPQLRLADGREPEGATTLETHLGAMWQRFSWHYADGAAWRCGRSSLLTHLDFCKSRLALAK